MHSSSSQALRYPDSGAAARTPPNAGGNLEALQLRDGRGDAGASLPLRPGCDALPAKQESHEILRGDRFDLLRRRCCV